MSSGIDWTTVSVALITALSAAGGPFWIWHRQAARERESVRAALMAEVLAFVELVALRGYVEGLRDAQAHLSPPEGVSVTEIFEPRFLKYSVNIHEHYNRVYQANVTRLGGLSTDEARQIVRFYQLADSVRLDVTAGGVLFSGTADPDSFGEAADLLEAAMKIGRELTSERNKKKWGARKTAG